ncbi:MAG: hypothetical protein Q7S09_05900 [bacterium]|nr:hypothetical protein [bacterium]
MEDKIQQIKKRARRCALAGLVSLATILLFAGGDLRIPQDSPTWATLVLSVLLGLTLGFSFAAVILFFSQLVMRFRARKGGIAELKPLEAITGAPAGGKRWKKILIRIVIGWFALGAAVSIGSSIYTAYVPKSCETAECFIEAANRCRWVEYDHLDKGFTFWRYSAPAGCGRFEKTAAIIGSGEPAWMKEFLEDKSLSCTYTRGEFNEQWVTSLVFGLEDCQGELKEAIGQLLFLTQ